MTAPATVGKDAVWFRREIIIPHTLHGYSLTGTDVSFQFQADANGPMPEIIYFDGRRVALGDDLEEIPLVPQREARRQGAGRGEAAAHRG